ncbi:hypothetical protein HUU40_00135 [candidate division KSB1 bacterium]|nr:hypothetical protein [candidate division KSB1 bacterium]
MMGRDFENIRKITIEVCEVHSDCHFTIDDSRMFLRVIARCNGAALRDLVQKLDTAGYMD